MVSTSLQFRPIHGMTNLEFLICVRFAIRENLVEIIRALFDSFLSYRPWTAPKTSVKSYRGPLLEKKNDEISNFLHIHCYFY